MENVNTAPLLGVDLTEISPSKTSHIVLQILRPRPIPLVLMLEVALNLPKTLNSYYWSSVEIPTPVSFTLTMR
jgi:hypothetical protein